MDSLTKKNYSELLKLDTKIPHYFVVKLENHPNGLKQVHCGTWKDVEHMLSMHPDSTVTQMFPPEPKTVDVPYVTIKDQELPMQQILPQSTLEEINLK